MNPTLASVHSIMRNLQSRIGSFEATAAAIEAYTGKPAHISTLSRRMNGSASWALEDVLAMQHAVGTNEVLDFLNRGAACVSPKKAARCAVSLLSLSSAASKECGEAVGAAIDVDHDDMEDLAETGREIKEAIAALLLMDEKVEGMMADLSARTGQQRGRGA